MRTAGRIRRRGMIRQASKRIWEVDMRLRHSVALMLGMAVFMHGTVSVSHAAPPTAEQIEKMKAAMPEKAPATPLKPRKMLVFTLCKGFRHSSIECCAQALEMMGKKTGAFETVVSDDVALFKPESLRGFDAVCFDNTTGELFEDPTLKHGLLDFVRSGKGIVGIHAATDCFYNWPEFGEMMGGYFDGHPWYANNTVHVKIDEPDHPINAAFGGKSFDIMDEIYQIKAPYSRDKLRVLLSLDTTKTDMNRKGIKRKDGDFAISWIREYGQGRVFYCSLGHREDIFWNPMVLEYYLAGIQYALGDLKADATPSTKAHSTSWTPLFNRKDLAGWKGLVGSPVKRAQMSADELADAQAKADEDMRQHWSVEGGVLVFDGNGHSICTAKDYGDFEMLVDWKIEAGGDSGIYLRGSPQVQIWDPARAPGGSGGLYNNQKNPSKPICCADSPIGEWNTFRIKMIGENVSVWLNHIPVVIDVPLENYWERGKPIYPTGQIELQSHGSKLYFKDIMIRAIGEQERRLAQSAAPWRPLFNGSDLTGWQCKPGSWKVENGELVCVGGSYIWTEDRFGDFMLEFEFKIPEQGNSGVFFRTANIADPVQTGIEFQVYDTYGQEPPSRNHCGAIYDCLAPKVQAVGKPGEWNHAVLICRGPWIDAHMNGHQIIQMNLDEWTEPNKNPDGSPNKYGTAYKDMPRVGYIGLQDHGNPIWYRNIRVKPLTP